MHLKPSPDALAQQLYLLTLTLEHALGREDWEEANALFLRREAVLDLLESVQITPSANQVLGQVQHLEASMINQLRTMQMQLASEQRADHEGRRARKVYRTSGSPTMGVTLAG